MKPVLQLNLGRATSWSHLCTLCTPLLFLWAACGDPGSFSGLWGGSLSSPEWIHRVAIATMTIGRSSNSADMSIELSSNQQECSLAADRDESGLQAALRPGGTCAIAGIPSFKWISGTLSVATGALEMSAVYEVNGTEMGELAFRGSRYK